MPRRIFLPDTHLIQAGMDTFQPIWKFPNGAFLECVDTQYVYHCPKNGYKPWNEASNQLSFQNDPLTGNPLDEETYAHFRVFNERNPVPFALLSHENGKNTVSYHGSEQTYDNGHVHSHLMRVADAVKFFNFEAVELHHIKQQLHQLQTIACIGVQKIECTSWDKFTALQNIDFGTASSVQINGLFNADRLFTGTLKHRGHEARLILRNTDNGHAEGWIDRVTLQADLFQTPFFPLILNIYELVVPKGIVFNTNFSMGRGTVHTVRFAPSRNCGDFIFPFEGFHMDATRVENFPLHCLNQERCIHFSYFHTMTIQGCFTGPSNACADVRIDNLIVPRDKQWDPKHAFRKQVDIRTITEQ